MLNSVFATNNESINWQHYGQPEWKGMVMNADIDLRSDLDEDEEYWWDFSIIMRKPTDDEDFKIVDTLTIGGAATLTPFNRAFTVSVPYETDSAYWTDPGLVSGCT